MQRSLRTARFCIKLPTLFLVIWAAAFSGLKGVHGYFPDIDTASFSSGSVGFRVTGKGIGDRVGFAVSALGDVNGDGFDDVGFGSLNARPLNRGNAGTVTVIYGRSSPIDVDLLSFSSGGFVIYGAWNGNRLGGAIAGAGDINGDGIDDIIVASSLAGVAYIIFGRPTSNPFAAVFDLQSFTSGPTGFKVLWDTAGDSFGWSVGGGGDVNGDGRDDILIGAINAAPFGRVAAGAVYVIFGRSSADTFSDIFAGNFTTGTTGFRIYGAVTGDYLGYSTNIYLGDVNGDGYDDILATAPTADPLGRSRAGTAYVIFGHSGLFADIDLLSFTSGTAGFKIFGAQGTANLGHLCSIGGDLNNDGYDDVVLGAIYYDYSGRVDSGIAYVLFGRRGPTFADVDLLSMAYGTLGFRIYGAASYTYLGNSVDIVGDVNMDGVDDLIIGEPNYSSLDRSICGSAMVIFGHSNKTTFPDIDSASPLGELGYRVYGASGGDTLGNSVAPAGDVNNDGTADFVVGARQADPSGRVDAGLAYVVFGSYPPPTAGPTASPTGPTSQPTGQPTSPTSQPSSQPSRQPSRQPTSRPSRQPSRQPTRQPTRQPSSHPSVQPSSQPSVQPSVQPSLQPTTALPSAQPSEQPTSQPSREPSSQPSALPSAQPSSQPLAEPTAKPSTPTAKPSASLTCAPSISSAQYARLLSSPTYGTRNGFAFAALATDGSVHTWGEAPHGGDSTAVAANLSSNITAVVSSRFAFAAVDSVGHVVAAWGPQSAVRGAAVLANTAVHHLVANEAAFAGINQSTGGVVAFGSDHDGGDVLHDAKCNGYSSQLSANVVNVVASAAAFAALKADGSVYAWGNVHTGAGVSSDAMPQLAGVSKVVATREAFAALLSSGRVVTWGGQYAGGDSSAVASELQSGVVHIVASNTVFVAIKHDQRAVPWGYGPWGGDASAVTGQLTQVVFVAHTFGAVAVVRTDGSVVAWGEATSGGDASAVHADLVNVEMLYGNNKAFAALISSGRVVAWGKAAYGGQIPSNKVSALSSGVVSIHHTDRAFAALKSDGSVVVWGQAGHGGSPGAAVEAHLVSGVHTICSNNAAFVAIKVDGSVVGWGHPVSIPDAGIIANNTSLVLPIACA